MRVSCLLLCVLCAGVYLLSSYSLPTVAVFAAIAAAREINNSFPEAKKRKAKRDDAPPHRCFPRDQTFFDTLPAEEMRLNYDTCLIGRKVVLVPYRPEHVKIYHDWMLDPFLLEMTGSEPLTYEEEVEMQKSWRDDDKKVTFIVLDRSKCEGVPDGPDSDSDSDSAGASPDVEVPVPDFVRRNLPAMVGDVNLFLSVEEEEGGEESEGEGEGEGEEGGGDVRRPALHAIEQGAPEGGQGGAPCAPPRHMQAELDIMIAEAGGRGRGLGSEASRLMMRYGSVRLGIRRFFAKIRKENEASRGMFGRMGFAECSYVECFGEYEYELRRDSAEEMADGLREGLGFDAVEWKGGAVSRMGLVD